MKMFPPTYKSLWNVPTPTKVETPETFSCLANKVLPVTVVIPANVDSPETFRLSKDGVSDTLMVAIPFG